jgi:ribosome-associated heat shock protein Hsp15
MGSAGQFSLAKTTFTVAYTPMQNNKTVRLDRWLWAARFYKTRSLAVAAIKRGRITIDAGKAKPARSVATGNRLTIRKAQLVYDVTILALSEKRLSARLASELYMELPDSIAERELRAQTIKANQQMLVNGRPSKKNRRLQQAIKRQEE